MISPSRNWVTDPRNPSDSIRLIHALDLAVRGLARAESGLVSAGVWSKPELPARRWWQRESEWLKAYVKYQPRHDKWSDRFDAAMQACDQASTDFDRALQALTAYVQAQHDERERVEATVRSLAAQLEAARRSSQETTGG